MRFQADMSALYWCGLSKDVAFKRGSAGGNAPVQTTRVAVTDPDEH